MNCPHRVVATWTGWAQNIAMGLQILIGALTTGLGAALTGKSVRGRNLFALPAQST
jgi:hypothetical protein